MASEARQQAQTEELTLLVADNSIARCTAPPPRRWQSSPGAPSCHRASTLPGRACAGRAWRGAHRSSPSCSRPRAASAPPLAPAAAPPRSSSRLHRSSCDSNEISCRVPTLHHHEKTSTELQLQPVVLSWDIRCCNRGSSTGYRGVKSGPRLSIPVVWELSYSPHTAFLVCEFQALPAHPPRRSSSCVDHDSEHG